MTILPPRLVRGLARLCEPIWLQRHLGWTVTAPANDNRAPSPLGAA